MPRSSKMATAAGDKASEINTRGANGLLLIYLRYISAELPPPPGETIHLAPPLLILGGIKPPWRDRPWFSRRRNRAKALAPRYRSSRRSRRTRSEGRAAHRDRRRCQRPPFPFRANFRALSRKQPGPLARVPRRPDRPL